MNQRVAVCLSVSGKIGACVSSSICYSFCCYLCTGNTGSAVFQTVHVCNMYLSFYVHRSPIDPFDNLQNLVSQDSVSERLIEAADS